jgi:uncharacterized protein YkwD
MVIAGAAFAGPVLAQDQQAAACTIQAAGLPATVDQYLPAAQACLAAPPAGITVRADLEAQALAALNAQRADAGLAPLTARPALSDAARLHTIDMAARGYAAHVDPEGRDHLDRIRTLDRTGLIGAVGGNVAILEAGDDIAVQLSAEGVDRDNVLRQEFTDVGLAVAEADGRTFAVAVFARVDGELDAPLPVTSQRIASVRSDLDRESMPMAGLRLSSVDGAVLAHSPGRSIRAPGEGDAYLDIAIDQGDGVLYLRGPATHIGG